MTGIAGRALHPKARAFSELIRVTSRLVAPTGCVRHDEANARLRFRDARLAIAGKVHSHMRVMSSQLAAHRCDARLLRSGNIEQQLHPCIFRFRIVRAAPRSHFGKTAFERAQLRFASSRRTLLLGPVARSAIVPNGGCELPRSPRFFWARMWRPINESVANVCRECSRADSRCVVSRPRPTAWIPEFRTATAHFATSRLPLFRPCCRDDAVARLVRFKTCLTIAVWLLIDYAGQWRELICNYSDSRRKQLKIETHYRGSNLNG